MGFREALGVERKTEDQGGLDVLTGMFEAMISSECGIKYMYGFVQRAMWYR